MVKIELDAQNLVVHMSGLDVVLALRSTFTVPLAHVVRAAVRPPDAQYDRLKGLRAAGGYFPGSFATGLFWITGGAGDEAQEAREHLVAARERLHAAGAGYEKAAAEVSATLSQVEAGIHAAGLPESKKHWAFYEVHDPAKAIGIDVEQQKISRLVVQVDDETPEAAVERIHAAVARARR